MASKAKIIDALSQLSAADDSHWTDDGLPAIAVMRTLTGDATLTRADVTKVDDTFTRNSAIGERQNPAKDEVVDGVKDDGADAGKVEETDVEVKPGEAGRFDDEASVTDVARLQGDDGEFVDEFVDEDKPDLPPLDAVNQRITEMEAYATKLKAKFDEAKADYDEFNVELDRAREFRDQNYAYEKPGDAIRGYLDRQLKNLADRYSHSVKVRQALQGLEIAPTAKSPIDSAMARDHKRGRPTFTVKPPEAK